MEQEKRFRLSPEKSASIYEKIERHYFKNTDPSNNPEAIVLGGQPGSGKSALLEKSKTEFDGANVVTINGDELRYFHPQYREIQKFDERRFAEHTDPQTRPWTKQLFDRTIETRRNVVFEGTMREAGPITATMRELREHGYKVTARVIAVNERESIAGVFRRYEEQKAAKGFGRWTNLNAHDEAYKGMPETISYIEKHKLADRVEVYSRTGQLLYSNQIQENEWEHPPGVRSAIETERSKALEQIDRQSLQEQWKDIVGMMSARNASDLEIQNAIATAHRFGIEPYTQPEIGKVYRGNIIHLDQDHVIQSTHEGLIRHERLVLSGDEIKKGGNFEVRYPYARVAIVKSPSLENSMQKGKVLEPKDFCK